MPRQYRFSIICTVVAFRGGCQDLWDTLERGVGQQGLFLGVGAFIRIPLCFGQIENKGALLMTKSTDTSRRTFLKKVPQIVDFLGI